jgi:hypothetical protein
MVEAQKTMKIQADRTLVPVALAVGELVMFNKSKLEKQTGSHSRYAKIKPKLLGPFKIGKFIAPNVVELDQVIPVVISKVVNVCFLTPYNRQEDLEIAPNEVGRNLLLYHYNSDVMLDPKVFAYVCDKFDFRPNIDLFASRRHHQLSTYCSKDSDEFAFCRDCFTFSLLC